MTISAKKIHTKKIRATRGFTLVEVLVALVIVAIAVAAGLRVSGAQINASERATRNIRAQLCVTNQLVALRLSRQYPDTGSGTKVCEQAGQTLTVRTEVLPTPNPSFRHAKVSAHPDPEAQSTWLSITTVIGRF